METLAQLSALAERVEKLEKQNRRLSRICLSALLVLSALILMGQAGQKTVEAHEFILRDNSGRLRGVWKMGSGGALFLLADENGKAHVILDGTTINGPTVALNGLPGLSEINVQVGANGPEIALHDKNGKLVWRVPVP